MKRLQFILILFIVFFAPNVFALEVDVTNSITSPETSGTGKYRGTEILNTGAQSTYNVKTRYQGRLSRIIYNLPLPSDLGDCFTTNANYTVTMYMETNDWNNKFGTVKVRPYSSSSTNWSSGTVTYVSYKKIYFTFKIPSSDTTCYDFVWIDLPSTNLSTTGITQISNWNLNKITLTDPTISTGGSGGSGGSSPTPTPDSSQAIINNQNQNTQSIMENDDANTQDIISSIQETTQQVSDTINNVFMGKCANIFNPDTATIINGWIYGTGMRVNSNNGNRMAFIPIEPDTDYTISRSVLTSTFRVSDYTSIPSMTSSNVDYSIPQVVENNNGNTIHYHTSSNARYLIIHYGVIEDTNLENSLKSIMVNEGTTALSYCPYGSTTEQNKIDELNDKLDGIGHIIEDAQVDDKSSFFTGFQDNSHGLTGIITAPLTTIQGLANKSCVPLSIPIPYTNSNVSLPCMTEVYQTYVPTVFSIWQVVSFGLISYFICIDIFKMVKGFKDPNEDKVEVLDL